MSETQQQKLNSDFVIELLKACLVSDKILEICKKHLKYQFLETESQKKVLKYIFESHDTVGKAPTVGMIGQSFLSDKDVMSLLVQIKKVNITDIKDEILKHFEQYIKNSRFIILHSKVVDIYNEGKKEEAIEYLAKESQEINEFSLKQSYHTTVFKDYFRRQDDRERSKENQLVKTDKLPFGIREIDEWTGGGKRRGTLACYMASSGGGKSTAMKWDGLTNARLGNRVVHFSQEGSEREILDGYDAAWTSISLSEISFGTLPEHKKKKILLAHSSIMANKGEIFVYASESFDSLTLSDCRDILQEIVSQYGPIDLIIWDYLELFNVRRNTSVNSEGMERKRREDVANGMVNLAVEFNAAGLTATQSTDIPPAMYNNPDFVLTRSNISEFKGMVKPLSYFLTINRTTDEITDGNCRIHADKFRHHPAKQTCNIAQALNIGRFYDNDKTNKLFHKE